MQAELSIVIPTLNAARTLPGTADALLPGLIAGLVCELIIADGGSDDGTRRMADSLGAQLVDGGIDEATRQARGAWLLLLGADSRLDPHWPDSVGDHLGAHTGGACFRLAVRGGGMAAAVRAALITASGRSTGRPRPAQGLLIRRDRLTAMRGPLTLLRCHARVGRL